MDSEKVITRKRLQSHIDQINAIMSLYDQEKGRVVGREKIQKSRELMRDLKESLKKDCACPAVAEAASRIQVRWNSAPDHRWVSELGSAKTDLRYALHGLED